jgi:hypothetical protein
MPHGLKDALYTAAAAAVVVSAYSNSLGFTSKTRGANSKVGPTVRKEEEELRVDRRKRPCNI